VRGETLAALRKLKRRQSDVEAMLAGQGFEALELMPVLDLEPTPRLQQLLNAWCLKDAAYARTMPGGGDARKNLLLFHLSGSALDACPGRRLPGRDLSIEGRSARVSRHQSAREVHSGTARPVEVTGLRGRRSRRNRGPKRKIEERAAALVPASAHSDPGARSALQASKELPVCRPSGRHSLLSGSGSRIVEFRQEE
jgi:hypothetical protein